MQKYTAIIIGFFFPTHFLSILLSKLKKGAYKKGAPSQMNLWHSKTMQWLHYAATSSLHEF